VGTFGHDVQVDAFGINTQGIMAESLDLNRRCQREIEKRAES